MSVPSVPWHPTYHPSHDLHGALADRPPGERRRAPRGIGGSPRPRRRSGARSPTVWTVGDSITAGVRLDDPSTESYPAQLRSLGSRSPRSRNARAMPGRRRVLNKSAMLETVASVLGAAQPGDVLVLEAGTNDLGRATDAQLKRGYRAVVRGGAARGVEVVVGTIPPRGEAKAWLIALTERQRVRINYWLRTRGMGNRGLRRQVGTPHRSRTGPAVRLRRWAPSQRQGGSRHGPPRGEVARPALSRPERHSPAGPSLGWRG